MPYPDDRLSIHERAAMFLEDQEQTVKRRRYATRDELADLLVPYLEGLDEEFPDGDGYKWRDVALKALDALGEMQAPVDALVKITVDEEV